MKDNWGSILGGLERQKREPLDSIIENFQADSTIDNPLEGVEQLEIDNDRDAFRYDTLNETRIVVPLVDTEEGVGIVCRSQQSMFYVYQVEDNGVSKENIPFDNTGPSYVPEIDDCLKPATGLYEEHEEVPETIEQYPQGSSNPFHRSGWLPSSGIDSLS